MNNSNEIKLINENGVEKTYGQIPDLWHIAEMLEGDGMEEAAEMVRQVWMMAHDLKSVAEEQRGNGNHKARLTEVRGLNQYQRGQLDHICATMTAFSSFFDLVDAKGEYRPSVDMSISEMRILADAYDKFQEEHGDDRRAFRFGGES